jgi:hypothetical protein
MELVRPLARRAEDDALPGGVMRRIREHSGEQ